MKIAYKSEALCDVLYIASRRTAQVHVVLSRQSATHERQHTISQEPCVSDCIRVAMNVGAGRIASETNLHNYID